MVSNSAVIGIDFGCSSSYVAYVGKGIVDLVQNEVSQRATSSLVGFTSRERLLGDAALAQIGSNVRNTCRNFKHLLGRHVGSPDLEKEHFWSTSKLATADDGFAGYEVTYKGEERVFSATQITAMYLTKLKEVTEKWCQAKVADAVISVPACFSDVNRQALLDAAKIAGISVLRLMNEHTATALAYGIYRSNDFDPDTPTTVVFCSMGHSIFSVSVVQFFRGKLNILCERSAKVGGRDMDECLMTEFAAQFKKKVGCDPLTSKKAAYKLEDAVAKTKKILSANSEARLAVECLMEDEDFQSNMTRDSFEAMCKPMMDQVKNVLEGAKAMMKISLDKIDSMEAVGGASRVPWLKRMCSEAFGGKELATTMNADESVARGCALQAAILSPLFRVRDFKVEESSSFAITIGWMACPQIAENGIGGLRGEGDKRIAHVFPSGTTLNLLKMLTFYRKAPFEVKAAFANDEVCLLPDTSKELGTFRIDVPPQEELRKVKVKAKLTLNGTFTIEGAHMVEGEEYEETIKEQREIRSDLSKGDARSETPLAAADKEAKPDSQMSDTGTAPPSSGDGERECQKEKQDSRKEESAKKFEWVEVVKKRTRVKRTDLRVTATGLIGLGDDRVQKHIDEETGMQAEMNEVIETNERRNDLESYIFNMRDKVKEGGEYGEFISIVEREKFQDELIQVEDWLYDDQEEHGRTKAAFIDKLGELKVLGDVFVGRRHEDQRRGESINVLMGLIEKYRRATEYPGGKYGHNPPDKLAKITAACAELEKWLMEMKAKQDSLPKCEKPVLTSAEVERRGGELAGLAGEALREESKPAPSPAGKREEKEVEAPAHKEKEVEAPDATKTKEPPREVQKDHVPKERESAAKVEEPTKKEAKQTKGAKAAPAARQQPIDGPANMDVD